MAAFSVFSGQNPCEVLSIYSISSSEETIKTIVLKYPQEQDEQIWKMYGYNTEHELQIHKIIRVVELILAIQITRILHGSGERKRMGKIGNRIYYEEFWK